MIAGSILLGSGLGDDVPLLMVVLAGALYGLGVRRMRTSGWRRAVGPARVARERWRTASFLAGLATIALALGEPIDGLADELFWVHMIQHVLLLVVAAPLLVIGAPWMPVWRAFPLAFRRRVARAVARRRWAAPLRATARLCSLPVVAFVLMNADILAWHLPAAYEETLRSNAAHYAEHATFLLLGVIGWAQAIDSPPYRSRLSLPHRGVFAFGSMVVGWLLALPMAFAGKPWYAHYAELHHRPGGISAIADQYLAAGIMWVPASIPWSIAIFVLIYMWVSDRDRPAHTRRLTPVAPPQSPPPTAAPERVAALI
ncbi:MAG: cytochrome c oxidase assembly protein, partial [Solirubrobacteraceae bacterium]